MVKQQILSLDPAERVITEIKRHKIGEYFYYAIGVFGLTASIIIMFVGLGAEEILGNEPDDTMIILSAMALMALFLLISYIGLIVYRANELVITNENLIQILQHSLLSKQVSQLNLAKIQDVSVDQKGIMAHFFNYGTLTIETAGEAANFRFIYAPEPNKTAKIIVEAHEDFIRKHGVRRGTI